MKTILLPLAGIVLYTILNTIIEVKLKHLQTTSLMCGLYIVLLPVVTGIFLMNKRLDPSMSLPTGNTRWIVVGVALMFLLADYLYYGSFSRGGNVVTITTLLVLMPVISGIIKFVWVKESPSPYHISAIIFATIAVILVALGNTKKTVSIVDTEPNDKTIHHESSVQTTREI
jgi:drug/metabolite transporter (DMT)-like permease